MSSHEGLFVDRRQYIRCISGFVADIKVRIEKVSDLIGEFERTKS